MGKISKTYALSLTIIVVMSCLTLLTINPANDQSIPTHVQSDIRIGSFSVDNQWYPIISVVMDCGFNLTIKNQGLNDVTGLVLNVKMFNSNREIYVGNFFDGTYENGTVVATLHAGEVREFKGTLMTHVGDDAYQALRSNGTSIVAFVTLDNTVLDQQAAPYFNPTIELTASPTPTVPELSWLVIVPLLLSIFSVAVIVRHRKTVSLNKVAI